MEHCVVIQENGDERIKDDGRDGVKIWRHIRKLLPPLLVCANSTAGQLNEQI